MKDKCTGKTILITVLSMALLISFCCNVMLSLNTFWVAEDIDFVAGEYGERCYPEGNEHKLIVYPHYFKTLAECENYINRNKK